MCGGRKADALALLVCFAALARVGADESLRAGAGVAGACSAGPGEGTQSEEGDHDELAAVQIGRARATQPVPQFSAPGELATCGLRLRQVDVNGYKFDCAWTSYSCKHKNKGNVMALHGFPESKETFAQLMKELAKAGFCAAACDQRGYSPGASPNAQEDYLFSLLQSDAFGFADAFGFGPFHLVGHDFGAILSWMLATGPHKDRLLSLSALQIPHVDAFSAGLFGPGASRRQQAASQYFEMFARGSSASLYGETIYKALGGGPLGLWPSAQEFQKPVWWYANAFGPAAGQLALPPLLSVKEIVKRLGPAAPAVAFFRTLFGGALNDGKAASNPIGDVSTPTLFVCGSQDDAILCSEPWSLKTEGYCKGGYQYLEVECDHDVLNCTSPRQTRMVTRGIIAHIEQNVPK